MRREQERRKVAHRERMKLRRAKQRDRQPSYWLAVRGDLPHQGKRECARRARTEGQQP